MGVHGMPLLLSIRSRLGTSRRESWEKAHPLILYRGGISPPVGRDEWHGDGDIGHGDDTTHIHPQLDKQQML